MKKILLVILGLVLFRVSVYSVENEEILNTTAQDIKLKRQFDEFEARVRKHLKTKKITISGITITVTDAGWLNITAKNGVEISGGGIILEPGEYLWFDNGSTTNVREVSDGIVEFLLNGSSIRFTNSSILPGGDANKNLGSGTANDWNIIYYHTLSQHSGRDSKENIEDIEINTLLASRLPSPKTYERKTSTGTIEYGLIAEDCPSELIAYDEDGKIMIQTNALIAYLCGTIKELEKRVVELEK